MPPAAATPTSLAASPVCSAGALLVQASEFSSAQELEYECGGVTKSAQAVEEGFVHGAGLLPDVEVRPASTPGRAQGGPVERVLEDPQESTFRSTGHQCCRLRQNLLTVHC